MNNFIVEISARHVHLSEQDLYTLFGEGYQLQVKKELSQPGQYACVEKVTIVGAKGQLQARILGPTRKESQVEVSISDAYFIGLQPLIRESGDIEGTNGVKLIGPKGELTLTKGLIAAKRHIHMTEADAKEFGVKNGDIVKVEVGDHDRSLIFDNTVIRVSDKFSLAMHIDTDEGNACGQFNTSYGRIIK